MTKLTRKYKSVKKDKLFYDQFEYCIGFFLQEVNCLRILDHASIDDMIQRRKQWREIAQRRWNTGGKNHSTILGRSWQDITEITSKNLHDLAAILLNTNCKFKLVVSINQGYVYTNDQGLIDELDDLAALLYKSYSQSQIDRPKNTIKLKNPKFKFRSYLAPCMLTLQQKEHLQDFLLNQNENAKISPALQRWLDQSFNRVQDYFFIDHNTQSWLTMLALVNPGIVRKTMHIIPAK